MKTALDESTRNGLIERIRSLNEDAMPQWGKMNVYQMVKHCTLWEELMLGKKKYKQALIGILFGKMALRGLLKDDRPLTRNTPTIPDFKVRGSGDFSVEKKKWIILMEEHARDPNPGIMHPFFGKMTKDQIGQMVYKHTDHHLRQFNS